MNHPAKFTHIVPILERAISRYLALDPETLKRLTTLTGKVVKIELLGWDSVLYLFPHTKGIAIKLQYAGTPDATIKGTPFELVRLRLSDEKAAVQLARKLEIQGDIHLAQTFNHILHHIEIDWEELVSHFTGDIIAHQAGLLARKLKHWRIQTQKNLGLNVTEYLHEESRQLPSPAEVEHFFTEVSRLQHDLARLEAKLNQHSAI